MGAAVKLMVLPGQTLLTSGETTTDGTGAGRTVMLTLASTVLGAAQVAVDVITTFTTSLLFNVELVKPALFVPAGDPFTYHWYDGLPPFVGVAVKVTDVPGQILLALAATLTEGTGAGNTLMV